MDSLVTLNGISRCPNGRASSVAAPFVRRTWLRLQTAGGGSGIPEGRRCKTKELQMRLALLSRIYALQIPHVNRTSRLRTTFLPPKIQPALFCDGAWLGSKEGDGGAIMGLLWAGAGTRHFDAKPSAPAVAACIVSGPFPCACLLHFPAGLQDYKGAMCVLVCSRLCSRRLISRELCLGWRCPGIPQKDSTIQVMR